MTRAIVSRRRGVHGTFVVSLCCGSMVNVQDRSSTSPFPSGSYLDSDCWVFSKNLSCSLGSGTSEVKWVVEHLHSLCGLRARLRAEHLHSILEVMFDPRPQVERR